jgi:Xaa-Pro aminopeptidase
MSIYQKRLDSLKSIMQKKGYNAFYIANITNVRYLSGFTGSSGFLLVSDQGDHFFSDGRYTEQSKNQVHDFSIHITTNHLKMIEEEKLLKSEWTLCFEGNHLSYDTYNRIKSTNGAAEMVAENDIVENIAAVKDQSEIDALQTAVDITDRVYDLIIPEIRVGVTEKHIASRISYLFKQEGGDGDSYDPIIASGANGALPHATPSDKGVEKGDFIVMDFGALYKGYHADMTRTIVVGKASDRHHEIYNIVLDSQLAGINLARSGIKCSDVDKACRDVIDAKGYGKLFMHSTGHGLGLEVHTLPRITWTNHNALEENNVITIEPGIYIAGWGGVRIEDDCLILKDSCCPMNSSTKELVVVN